MFRNAQTHTNPKNRLQEFCQRNSIGLPIYDSYRKDDGTFLCKSTIVFQKKTFVGKGKGLRLKESEMDAAEHVLSQLHLHQQSQIQLVNRKNNDTQGYIAIYIDLENINVNELTELFKFYKYNPTQYLFRGFLSTGHHYSETDFNFDGIAFEKILVPSTRSDAADIGMIMHAMTSTCNHHDPANIPVEIILVSRDRFSCVFVDLGEKGFCIDPKFTKVSHCSNVAQLKQLLGC